MNTFEKLELTLDRLPKGHELLLQHEFDYEPSYLVWDHDRDAELVCVQQGNYDLARFIAFAHKIMPDLLEAATSLDIAINKGGLNAYGTTKAKEVLNRLFGQGDSNGNDN